MWVKDSAPNERGASEAITIEMRTSAMARDARPIAGGNLKSV